VVTKYYYLGSTRVATRRDGALCYLLGDHLGSTSATHNPTTQAVAQQWYKPYGESRWSSGTLPTDRKFTGQRRDSGTGLLFYNARWYDPAVGRFLQADTLVPGAGDPQSLNRYMYSNNNPLRYTDPSGHVPVPVLPIPPFIPFFQFLRQEPVIGPLIDNPQIAAPVAYALYREAKGGYIPEALTLTTDWYFEKGEAPRVIGPESEITQFLKTDKGVEQARQEFIKRGGTDMVGADQYDYKFGLADYGRETIRAVRADEWSGSFLGGYQVEIAKNEGNICRFTVINETGWASGTRLPEAERIVGHRVSIRPNVDRLAPGPGGTLWQYYQWEEEVNLP